MGQSRRPRRRDIAVNGGAGGAAPTSSNAGPFVDQGTLDLGRTEVFTLANYTRRRDGGHPDAQPVQAQRLRHLGEYRRPDDRVHADQFRVRHLRRHGRLGGIPGDRGARLHRQSGGRCRTFAITTTTAINNTIGQGKLGGIYVGSAYYGGGQVRLDEQEFVLPSSFNSATLTDIILHGYGNIPDGEPFLAAATVATPNRRGPGQHHASTSMPISRTYSNGTDYPLGGRSSRPGAARSSSRAA